MNDFVKLEIDGLENLIQELEDRVDESRKSNNGVVTVGYATGYSIFVHEDTEKVHENGQCKFLEQPARQLQSEMAAEIKKTVERGGLLDEGNKSAGLLLLEASAKLVPIDTGNLKASGYIQDAEGNVETTVSLGFADLPDEDSHSPNKR